MRLGIIFSETDCRAVLLQYDNHQARCLETICIDKKQTETNWKKTALLTIKIQYSKHHKFRILRNFLSAMGVSQGGESRFSPLSASANSLRAKHQLQEGVRTKCETPEHTRVILGIENQRVIIRELNIDTTLTDEQIITFLKTQATHLFGAAAETLCIDYGTIAQSEKKKTIRAVVAHFSEIQAWEQLFLEMAFPLDVIDVDTFALFRFENYVAQHTLINQTSLSDAALKEFSTAIGLALWGINLVNMRAVPTGNLNNA